MTLRPFMRVVLDEMNDPDPVETGVQGTFAGYDGAGDLVISWDDGRDLKIIDGVDRWHVVTDDELDKSFENLWSIQGKLGDGESSRCPRCGEPFDCRRGAVSRRFEQIMICPLCGQQEAIEDFLIHGKEMGVQVNITIPEDKNKTGFEAEEAEDGKQKLKVEPKDIKDWYIVRIWQGREV